MLIIGSTVKVMPSFITPTAGKCSGDEEVIQQDHPAGTGKVR